MPSLGRPESHSSPGRGLMSFSMTIGIAVLSDKLCANFVTLMQKLNQVGRSLTGMQALYIPKFYIFLLHNVHILSSFLLQKLVSNLTTQHLHQHITVIATTSSCLDIFIPVTLGWAIQLLATVLFSNPYHSHSLSLDKMILF